MATFRGMMFATVLSVLVAAGCGRSPGGKSPVVARVNDYVITADEFREEFLASPYAQQQDAGAQEEFLRVLIERKLILQDAESRGFDREPGFLKAVERFWEQTLLKVATERKEKEFTAAVAPEVLRERYERLRAEGKTDRPFEEVKERLAWEAENARRSQLMNEWIEQLRSRARIEVKRENIR